MDAKVFEALWNSGLTEKDIVVNLGWETFLRYKVEAWRGTPGEFRADCGLPSFLGMTEDEYANWVLLGMIHDRVKRAWTPRGEHYPGPQEVPRVQSAPVLKDDWRLGETGQGTQRTGGTW